MLKFRKDVNSAIEADKYAKEFRRSVDEFIEIRAKPCLRQPVWNLAESQKTALQLEIIEQSPHLKIFQQ